MSTPLQHAIKIGILGGGQLGRLLIQAGMNWNIQFATLDPDKNAPCANISAFTHGELTDFDTVVNFGEPCDLITIEIENVNIAALRELVRRGKKVYPEPDMIELIQDKRRQKQYYHEQKIPTAEFVLTENREDVLQHKDLLPAVHKLATCGYDGRGVQIIKSANELDKAFDAPGVLERLVDFDKEIAVIVARNSNGEIATFPPVEMAFHPDANLVEYLFSPAAISEGIVATADNLARELANKMQLIGLMAVEMFVTADGEVLVNEIAPRPHNSGHHTIEANITSQYEQLLRAILNLPLGATTIKQPAAMVNLLGEPEYQGAAQYQGIDKILAMPGAYVHLYGKKMTKPFRKMGHVTILDDNIDHLREKVNFVKQHLKVIA